MNSDNKHKFILFFIALTLSLSFIGCGEKKTVQRVDVFTIQRKIDAGELKEITIEKSEIIAIDKNNVEFRAFAISDFYKLDLMKKAAELDANGKQKVERFTDESGSNGMLWGNLFYLFVPLPTILLILLAGVVGFILGRATKKLR